MCFVVLLLPTGSQAKDALMAFVASPFRSSAQNETFLDLVDLRVMFYRGYALKEDTSKKGLSLRLGVEHYRRYVKEDPQGARVIEFGVTPGPSGNFEFVIRGEIRDDPLPNDEVHEIKEELIQIIESVSSLRYEIYRLGHIQSDRAIALLGLLGYASTNASRAGGADKEGEDGGRGSEVVVDEILGQVWQEGYRLPMVIKIEGAEKTSLLEPVPAGGEETGGGGEEGQLRELLELGGRHLFGITSGEPQERLLIVYHQRDPESLEILLNLIQNRVDVPAQQILIEALILEINTSRLRDLGVEFAAGSGRAEGSFRGSDSVLPNRNRKDRDGKIGTDHQWDPSGSTSTSDLPFTFVFDSTIKNAMDVFKTKLTALSQRGDAEVLSSPSVLVLNDRQARIQVGQQIPIAKSTTGENFSQAEVKYFPVGIVLNLRPRINAEGTEVTLQIETIVSSIAERVNLGTIGGGQVLNAPTIDNRRVESYVRVANGSPFIVGGLLSTDKTETTVGIPIVSRIPLLGRLFRRERTERVHQEVIVVLTPHIVPMDDKSFSYLIPKDTDVFDRFDTQLFRNTYRVRDDDVWDLSFLKENPVLGGLVEEVRDRSKQDILMQTEEPFRTLLNGDIPGENILVRRMIWEIVRDLDFGAEVDLENVSLFVESTHSEVGGSFEEIGISRALASTLQTEGRTSIISYDTHLESEDGEPFRMPVATVRDTNASGNDRRALQWKTTTFGQDGFAQKWSIVIADETDLRRLSEVLVLKRILDLNKNLELTLRTFHPGIQVLFPTRAEMRRNHLIDHTIAQLFYETEW